MNINKKVLLSLAVTLGVSTAAATIATAYVDNYTYQDNYVYQQQPQAPAKDKDGSLFPGGPCKNCSKDGSLFPGGPCKSCTKDGSLFPGPCKKCEVRREQPVVAAPVAPAVVNYIPYTPVVYQAMQRNCCQMAPLALDHVDFRIKNRGIDGPYSNKLGNYRFRIFGCRRFNKEAKLNSGRIMEKNINFSEFHLPPLAVLFENAKSTPQIIDLVKAQQLAEAEVAKQKRHIFSYLTGHASYSYGVSDMWGNSSSSYNMRIMQFQGSEQKYWNVGVNLAVPVEDILDLAPSIRRKRLEADRAQLAKDMAYDQLKLQIATLYISITNDLITLKTYSESAAVYQGAGALNLEEFHNGNMTIEDFAGVKLHESDLVTKYQAMQTEITTKIITLEILTHTPILTNSTTEITLDGNIQKSDKQIAKENKAVEKRIKKAAKEEEEKLEELEKAEKKAAKEAQKSSEKK